MFLFFFIFIKIFAVECSLQVKQIDTFFTPFELEAAFLNIAGVVFNASQFDVLEEEEKPKACNVEVLTTGYTNVLAIKLMFGDSVLYGGSYDRNFNGLQESLVRAFYKDENFKVKICKFFGARYSINCLLYQQ